MSMEINGSTGRPPIETGDSGQTTNKVDQQTSANAAATASPGSSADKFSLTSKASQLQQLEAQISNLPVVDTQRVQDVQHSIATGSLQVEPAQVAEKMLAFESGLDK